MATSSSLETDARTESDDWAKIPDARCFAAELAPEQNEVARISVCIPTAFFIDATNSDAEEIAATRSFETFAEG
jgi:hypothetical protein